MIVFSLVKGNRFVYINEASFSYESLFLLYIKRKSMILSVIGLFLMAAATANAANSRGASVAGVFWVHSGLYHYTYGQAATACKHFGGELASLAQLNAAYKAGMNQCRCGWTTDHKAHYPISQKKSLINGCGGSKPGVRTCTWRRTWDAYCYKKPNSFYTAGPTTVAGVFWVHNAQRRYAYTYGQAATSCIYYGAVLASLAQMNAAYKAGMNECNCGWTTDHKAHYPISQKKSLINGCGGSKPGVRTCTWRKTWDAYCFRA